MAADGHPLTRGSPGLFEASNPIMNPLHWQIAFGLSLALVGGTDLIYEIDPSKPLPQDYKPEQLAAALKRRIDPTDLYNVTIRPLSDRRVEIILPTGGVHQAEVERQAWVDLLDHVRAHW